jgi:hypothetical protein
MVAVIAADRIPDHDVAQGHLCKSEVHQTNVALPISLEPLANVS